ncbi:MAG: GNAT family N-acetyltransferase [Bacteroidota bacterium]
MLEYTTARTTKDLQDILDLQWRNLPKNISQKEAIEQGFVTVHHDFEILEAMNAVYPHVIAKMVDSVVGYTLVMLPEFGDKIPVLIPLFEKINQLTYRTKLMKSMRYFVMGQVCIDKKYRGQGVFNGLYEKMKTEMSIDFDCIVTEIATRNVRSMRAHEKVGFETVHTYSTQEEEWAIVAWDWQ